MIAAPHRLPIRLAAVLAGLAMLLANPVRGAEGGDARADSAPAAPAAGTAGIPSSTTNSAAKPSEPPSREESKDKDNGTKSDAIPEGTAPGGSATNAAAASKSESEPGGGRDRDRRRRGGDRRDRGASSRGDGDSSSTSNTNSPSGRPDFSAFKIITERNIFSPTRAPSSSSRGEPRRQPKIENFSLVGTLSYDKGDFAFFDGSGSEFKKALKPDDTIAGHKIIEVTADEVKLEREGKTIVLRIGGQLRREDDGAWEVRNNARIDASLASKDGSDSTGSKDSGSEGDAAGGGDDILQRLLKKREQELNK